MFLQLKNVSYDDSSIYYNKKEYEVQVPFEDIASIEIKSITGIYGIKLFNPSQGRSEIFFKTSLWYPSILKRKMRWLMNSETKLMLIKEHCQE